MSEKDTTSYLAGLLKQKSDLLSQQARGAKVDALLDEVDRLISEASSKDPIEGKGVDSAGGNY